MTHLFDIIDAAPPSVVFGGAGIVLLALVIVDRALAHRWAKGE